MSFGRNPHVAKAEAAEQRALAARDAIACEQAWRDAARQWERAAERETDGKRRQSYLEKGEAARQRADASSSMDTLTASSPSVAKKPSPLN